MQSAGRESSRSIVLQHPELCFSGRRPRLRFEYRRFVSFLGGSLRITDCLRAQIGQGGSNGCNIFLELFDLRLKVVGCRIRQCFFEFSSILRVFVVPRAISGLLFDLWSATYVVQPG